jgi:hypothetical protein
VKARGNIFWIFVLAALLLGLGAASASAEPRLDLELNRDPDPTSTPVTHGDERALYRVVVKNTASTTPSVGDTVTCNPNDPPNPTLWFPGPPDHPTFTYQWLRDGTAIAAPGASPTYVVAPADEGQTLQCLVFGTNVSGTAVSFTPPVVVSPVPSPAPPSPSTGTANLRPIVSGVVAAPLATANTTSGSNVLSEVATVKGTGTLTSGSQEVTGVSRTFGSFLAGQAVSAPGISAATGSGDLSAATGPGTIAPNSKTVTGVSTTTGAFAVGQEVSGSGIITGTEIVSCSPSCAAPTSIGLSLNPSTLVTEPTSITLTAGSKTVTGVSTATGAFVVGQLISGIGISADTTVAACAPSCAAPTSLTLSSKAIGPGSGVALSGATRISSVGANTLTLSTPATASGAESLSAGSQPFAAGLKVSGPGIPPGTTVTSVSGQAMTLSAAATATATGVSIAGNGELSCTAPTTWSGAAAADWSFQWLRNGSPIPGATASSYTVTTEDVGESPPAPSPVRAVLQCEATATAVGGTAVAVSGSRLTSPSPNPINPNNNPGTSVASLPFVSFSSQLEGEVKVQAELPGGAETYALRVLGTGWSCAKLPPAGPTHASATCTRKDSLAPATSYPPIELLERPGRDAPDLLVTKVTVSGGGAPDPAGAEDTIGPLLPAGSFGFKAFKTEVLDELGADFTQAGGHPFSAGAALRFNEHVPSAENETGDPGLRATSGSVRTIRTDVPAGFAGNPEAVPGHELCETMAQVTVVPSGCPAASVVGSVSVELNEGTFPNLPVFAMEHEYGTPAQFAFAVEQLHLGFSLTPELRPADGYGVSLVSAPVSKNPELFAATATLCGFGAEVGPRSSSAELEVKKCRKAGEPGAWERPFLTLPTRCGDPASTLTKVFADSWEEAGKYAEAQFSAPALTGCDKLAFEPTLKARPTTTAADSPSGLEVALHLPQNEDPKGTATAQLKKTVVTLPEGLSVNPSGANGLGACSEAEVGMAAGVPGANPAHCPDASKVGTVEVETPILDHPLAGSLYVATPHDNPFDAFLALYLVVEDPETGIVVKVAGRGEVGGGKDVDPSLGALAPGQVRTVFDNNPQAPIEEVRLKVLGGPTAPLRTPATCDTYATASQLTPWSAPDSGPPATPSDSYPIDQGAGGAPCAQSEAQLPNAPAFKGASVSPLAAAYSPFVVKLSRADGSQQFSTVTVTPPPGLLAKLAGVPACPDSALAAAAAKSGAEEKASPSCPAASEVGTVVAGAGAGPSPYYTTGKAYLAPPYKGAPLSLAIVTPAVAGPFDIGTVVVRTALYVNPERAQVTAKSDPLPTILEGIPLDIRSAVISLDRPGFALNPTNCDPTAVSGQLLSTLGQAAPLSNRFQVAECARLGFEPSLRIRLKGSPKRAAYQRLTATLTAKPGEANIARAAVTLPHSVFLAQNHIRTICTRVQFAADQCPKGSIYGKATAITPLVDFPLSGPVYLRSSDNPLPDLVVALKGPDWMPIEVELAGRVDSKDGGIRNSFEVVPDAPVTKFTLQMRGGKKSLIVNSRDLCKGTQRATVRLSGQNGKRHDFRPLVGNDCRRGKHNQRRR